MHRWTPLSFRCFPCAFRISRPRCHACRKRYCPVASCDARDHRTHAPRVPQQLLGSEDSPGPRERLPGSEGGRAAGGRPCCRPPSGRRSAPPLHTPRSVGFSSPAPTRPGAARAASSGATRGTCRDSLLASHVPSSLPAHPLYEDHIAHDAERMHVGPSSSGPDRAVSHPDGIVGRDKGTTSLVPLPSDPASIRTVVPFGPMISVDPPCWTLM